MGRLALRPALRAHAHAPAAVETAAAWANAYSMYHDGSDDGWTSIGTSTPTIDAFKDAFSVSYWINTTSQGGSKMHMWLSPPYDASAPSAYHRMRLQVRHQGSDGKLRARVGVAASSSTDTITNTSWASGAEDLYGKWAHVAITVGAGTSSDVKIYVNGTLDKTGTSPSTAWATSENIEVTLMALPNSASTFSDFKNGYLDEVSLYDSELSAANVSALYNSGLPGDPSSLGLTPKLYYRMGDLTDTGGLSGLVVDQMGTGMDLDSLGAPAKSTSVPVYNYQSMYHDGTDDGWTSRTTSTPTIDAFKDALTWSAWVYIPTQTSGSSQYVWLAPPYSATAGHWFYRMRLQVTHFFSGSLAGKLRLRLGNATNNHASINGVTDWRASGDNLFNTWVHLAVTVASGSSSNAVKLYVNGSLDVTGNDVSSAWATSEDMEVHFMCATDGSTTYTNFAAGRLDEVSLYDYELSAADIATLYNAGKPNDPTSLNPSLFYRMGDLTDTDGPSGVIVDRMGTGMDLDSLGYPFISGMVP